MNEGQNPLKRRRRKMVVAFVLVVGLLVTWWEWPRQDARFVGKWALNLEVTDRALCELTFRQNGELSVPQPTQSTIVLPSTWFVEANVLVCGVRVPGSLQFLSPVIVPVMRRWSGRADWGKQERFEIKTCDEDAISLRHEVHKTSFVLRRIAE